jgi:flagellar protein FlaG
MDLRPTNHQPPPAAPAPGIHLAPPASASAAPIAAYAAAPAEKAANSAEALQQPSPEKLTQAIKNINSALQERAQGLEFSVDSATDRTVVKVIDTHTHEVIRQMPSQEALEIAKALDQLQSLMGEQKA